MVEMLKSDVVFKKPSEESKNHKLRKVFRGSIFDILFTEITLEKKWVKETENNDNINQEIWENQDKNNLEETSTIESFEANKDSEIPKKIPFVWIKKQKKSEEFPKQKEYNFTEIFEEIEEKSPYNPELDSINVQNLKKILSWKILNPNKNQDSEIEKNYSFFVICEDWLDEEIRNYFWPPVIKDFYKSSWFALINKDWKSIIVIPNRWLVEYNPKTKSKMLHKLEDNVWDFWIRMFDIEKNFNTKIIKTWVDLQNMTQIFTQIYWK